jgi:hypothetical protein
MKRTWLAMSRAKLISWVTTMELRRRAAPRAVGDRLGFCGGAGYTLLHGCLRLVRLQEGPDAVDRALLELWRLLPGVDRDLGLWRE